MSRARDLFWFVVLLGLLSCGSGTSPRPGAKALEARLLAPCCWGGTLDVHESDIARQLRHEIEDRLSAGETAETIQADLVERFGDRIVATRSDQPLVAMASIMVILAAGSFVGLGFLVRRWRRRDTVALGADEIAKVEQGPERDDLDARLDQELADLDVPSSRSRLTLPRAR